jgi:hypothetical protein
VSTTWWPGFSGRHEMTRFALVTWECLLCKGKSLTTGPSNLDVGRDARAGDEARTRDPYLGKVSFQFCIRDGSKTASKRVLTPNFHGVQR